MATLKTDYKDFELNTAVNPLPKYNMIQNADGTVSFEDVSTYRVEGDEFSAEDLNKVNRNLTADNGVSFDFGYDAENNQFGYMVDGELRPFSNAHALYEALQYSGLVTEDMTYDEMLEALANYFVEWDGVLVSNFQCLKGTFETTGDLTNGTLRNTRVAKNVNQSMSSSATFSYMPERYPFNTVELTSYYKGSQRGCTFYLQLYAYDESGNLLKKSAQTSKAQGSTETVYITNTLDISDIPNQKIKIKATITSSAGASTSSQMIFDFGYYGLRFLK